MTRVRKSALLAILVGAVLAAGMFALGRATGPDPASARTSGYRAGLTAGVASGLAAGRAQGVQEGRALQEGLALPADARDVATAAFNAGYRAGANDTFGGYDGGWSVGTPYLVTLDAGSGGVTYRISSRTPVQGGVNYYLCPQRPAICQEPRR
jgi:hypothetical protein